MTSVRVWQPFGAVEVEWTSPHVTADVFTPQVLTITHVASGDVVQTFGPAQWTRCSVYGADGYELFAFRNSYR